MKSVSTAQKTMKAIAQEAYGSPEVLELQDRPVPRPTPGQVLIQVEAAGVTRADIHLLTGKPYLMRLMGFGFSAPKNAVRGVDLAGRVVAVGAGVSEFQAGDEVFGLGNGAFAEFACAPVTKIALGPKTITAEQAAAVPGPALTALQGLRDAGRLTAGQSVLVIGAAGGVGSFAVQIAVALGADVTGVCSTGAQDLVKSLGAQHVIDYTSGDLGSGRYDLILDTAGNRPLRQLRKLLTPDGTLAIVGAEGAGSITGMRRQFRAMLLNPFVRQRLTLVLTREVAVDLQVISDLIGAGKVMPAMDRTFPLAEGVEAVRYVARGHACGRVVVTVPEPTGEFPSGN